MRWFDRDDGGMGNQELLSNALEETARNEVEERRLTQYKRHSKQLSYGASVLTGLFGKV